MIEKTKNFVTFYYPGAFVGESCTIEIDNRDPEKMFAHMDFLFIVLDI